MLSEKPLTLTGILWLISSIFVCVFFVTVWQGIIQHFVGKQAFEDGTLLFLVFSSLALHGSILCGTGLFLWIHQMSWSGTFGFRVQPLPAIATGFVAAIVFVPCGMVLQDISVRVLTGLHFDTPPQEAVEQFNKTVSLGSRVYLAAFAVFLAPVAEEVFFRGILYRGFKQIGYPRLALWGSALAFAAIHKSAAIFVPLFVLSLLLSWLYEKTGNLLASITTHATFNALNLILLSLGDRAEDFINRHFHHVS